MAQIRLISIDKEQERVAGDTFLLADKNLHLSMEIRENNVFACLLDKEINQYLAWASYNRRDGKDMKRSLDSILKEEMLNYKCSSSSIVLTHNTAMLIPATFFTPVSVMEYLKQQNLIKLGETPCSDFIKNNDCYSVYAVDTVDYTVLKEKYPQAIFRHHSSVFVEYLMALHKGSKTNEVHVFVFPGYIDVVALQPDKLLLYNRYHYHTPNDFAYFLIWVYEELKLKPVDCPCFLYGEIMEKSEMFDLAWRYLKNVRIAEKTARFTFSNMLENIPPHRYYSLFMQYLCI